MKVLRFFLILLVPFFAYSQLNEIDYLNVESEWANVIIGDANNDGENELVVLSDIAVTIYKYDLVNQNFVKLWEYLNVEYYTEGFIGDTDNDGENELIVRDSHVDGGTISIFEYTDGSWVEDWSISKASQAESRNIWVGDSDNDGLNEIVIGQSYAGGRKIEVYEYVSGSYSLTWSDNIGKDVYTVQVLDTDCDGDNEILSANGLHNPDVRIYEYDELNSDYDLVCNYSIGENVQFRAIGEDLDNDGCNEILVAIHQGWGSTNGIRILDQCTLVWELIDNCNITLSIIGDILNNGLNQFAFTCVGDSTIYIYQNNGTDYELIFNIPVNYLIKDIRVGDVFNSGENVFVVSGRDSVIHFFSSSIPDVGEFEPDQYTVALWHLNGNGADSSGSGNDLIVKSDRVFWVSGKYGQAAEMGTDPWSGDCHNSDGAALTAPGSGVTYPGSGDWTIEAWVKVDSFTVYYTVVSHYSKHWACHDPYSLTIRPDGKVCFKIEDSNTQTEFVEATLTTGTGEWFHIAGVYRYQQSIEVYENFELIGQKSTSLVPETLTNYDVFVGGDYCGTSTGLKVDEVRISNFARPVEIDNEIPVIPDEFILNQNYPNPFNPFTTIQYQLPYSTKVNISIYNIMGQLVETLVDEYKEAGYYSVFWNAIHVSSGMYFYKIVAGDFSDVKKCVILK